MKKVMAAWVLASCLWNSSVTQAEDFFYGFHLYTPGAQTPFYQENAFLRKENFYGTDSVRYWQPASPNRWAYIVYKVDANAIIESATIRADL